MAPSSGHGNGQLHPRRRIAHHDSNGGGGVIREGDTQWMTAGAGILHDELPTERFYPPGWPDPRRPAVGKPTGRPQVQPSSLPGHHR